MPKSPSANKLLTAIGLLCAIFAVSTPFWLFTSEQSVSVVNKNSATDSNTKVDSSKDKAKVTNSNASSKDTAKAADPKTESKDKVEGADAKADSKDKAAGADAKDASKDKAAGADAKDASKDKAADADAKDASKDKVQGADAQDASKDKVQGADANASSKDTAKAADAKTDSKDKVAGADAKDASKDKAAGADAKDASKDKAAGADTKDASKDKAAGADARSASNESKAIADAKSKSSGEDKFATAAVEKNDLSESVISSGQSIAQKPQSLADKVRDITRMRTAEDKAAYERSIKQREQQVDEAIASISGNYKIYLPNLFSEKAVVIYFSAPVSSTKINLRKDADLSKLKIDSLSGATVVKYQDQDTFEDVSEPAMDYIANTLSKESGAQLFKVATVTTYPDNVAKLYSMSFIELNERKYPELTDDVLLSIDKYSVVYLCYPNWWGNMPGAIYSFLAKYDLSDKIIVPVCLYEKDKFSGTTDTIATIEANASVYSKGLLISKEECKNESKLRNKIRSFLTELSKEFE